MFLERKNDLKNNLIKSNDANNSKLDTNSVRTGTKESRAFIKDERTLYIKKTDKSARHGSKCEKSGAREKER